MAGKRRAVGVTGPPPAVYTPPTLPGPSQEVPHPEVTKATSARWQQREILLPGVDDGPVAMAYGEQRLAGKLQYVHYSGDTLWAVIELCLGECDGLIDVAYSDGRTAPAKGGMWDYWWYAGTAAGQVDTNLAAVLSGWNEAFASVSYVVVRLNQFSSWWGGQMPDFVWHMRTRKCLMSDSGLYVYSTNFWDQWFDFVRWSEGKGLPASRVDAASFTAAKNADVAASRKTDCHFLLMEDSDPDDVIQTFRLIARAFWFPDANKWRVVADRPGTSVVTYDDRAISQSVKLDLDRTEIQERPNKGTIWYTAASQTQLPGGGFGPLTWTLTPMSLATAAVDAGTEDAIEEEYRLPHLRDPALVKTILTYIVNSRQYDAVLRERWLAITADRQLGDIVTRNIESRGLTLPMRLVRRVKNPDNTFDVELREHNDLKFAEYVVTETPRIASTFPDPSIAPPNIAAGSIGWTEEVYPTPTGDWLPKATLTFTPPPSFPFLDTVEVWLSINGGAQRHWFDTSVSPALTPALWETGTYALTLKTRHRVTQQVSSGTTVTFTVTGVTGTVPEVVDMTTDMLTRAWAMPQTRSITRYGSTFWSNGSGNFTTLDLAKINDGVLTATCLTTPAAASSWLRYDAGVGVTKAFRELTYSYTGSSSGPSVEYSDNNASWTSVGLTGTKREYFDAGTGVTTQTIMFPSGLGAHRYWRIVFMAGTATHTEFHFAEYLGVYAQVREFRVYDMRGGKKLYITIPVGAMPTASAPLNVEPITTNTGSSWSSGGQQYSSILVTVVNSAGSESVGVQMMLATNSLPSGAYSPYVAQQQTATTLSNGTNNAVALPPGPGFVRATGPTAPYSLGGLMAMGGGCTVFFCNATVYAMTVVPESTGATAANRIITPSGTSAIVQPGETVAFTYDTTASRWRFWSDSIEWAGVLHKPTTLSGYGITDAAPIASPALTGTPTAPTPATADNTTKVANTAFVKAQGYITSGQAPVQSVAGRTGAVTLAVGDVSGAAPLASPSFTGTPTAPTPAAADNSTKIATTAWVFANAGGGMERVASVNPNGVSFGGNSSTVSRPEGFMVNTTSTTSTSNVAVVNITGKGVLRFLSYGSYNGFATAYITVVVNGSSIITDYGCASTVGSFSFPALNRSLVGGIHAALEDGGTSYSVSAMPAEVGWPFTTGLQVYIRTSNAAHSAHVAFAYTVY